MAVVDPLENARNAVAATTPHAGNGVGGYPACNKAGLPILLVRPGIADAEYARTHVDAIRPLLKGTADAVPLPTSGYVARTLREGFVHVYYAAPQSAQIVAHDGWQIFRVSDGGYMTPYPITDAAAPAEPEKNDAFACSATANYGTAMLLSIADADRGGPVWVGFADHVWSPAVREHYAGDSGLRDQRMTRINAADASCEASVTLTQEFVGGHVVDYAARPVQRNNLRGNPYPPYEARPESSETLLDRANWIIEQGGDSELSIDNALVVGVADPIGVTTEAAVRRMSLTQTAQDWLNSQGQNGRWKLQTAQTIQNMLDRIDRQETKLLRSLDDYRDLEGQYVKSHEFQQMKDDGRLPPQATFDRAERGNFGHIRLPSQQTLDEQSADRKENITDQLDPAWSSFLSRYNAKKEEDKQLRIALDRDHDAWLQSTMRKVATEHDYDTATPCDGTAYATAVANVTCFGPQTSVSEESFATILSADPQDTNNLIMRALLGNQQSHFEWITAPEQQQSEYKAIATLLMLPQLEGGQAGKVTEAARAGLAGIAHPLLGVLGATAMVLNKQQSDSPILRLRIQRLAGATASQRRGNEPPALLEIHLPLADLMAAWRAQRNQHLESLQELRNGVRTHVAAGAMALALSEHPSAAEKMVKAWIWTNERPAEIQRLFGATKAAAKNRISHLKPAFSNLNRAWAAAPEIPIDRAKLSQLFTQSMTAARSPDGLLSTSVAIYDFYSLIEGLDSLETLSGQEREEALFKISAAALNVGGGVLDISGRVSQAWAKQATKGAGEAALKRASVASGRLIAGGTGIFAVAAMVATFESGLSAYSAFQNSDTDYGVAEILMTLINAASVVALGAVAAGTAGFSLLSVSAGTLIAVGSLIAFGLVLAIFAIGYWAAFAKDDAIANWAKRCIWGDVGVEKYGTQKAEVFALNKVFLLLTGTLHIRTDPGSVSAMPAGPDRRREQVKLTLQFPNSSQRVWGYVISGINEAGQRVLLASHKHGQLQFEHSWPCVVSAPGSEVEPEVKDDVFRQTVAFPHDSLNNIEAVVVVYANATATQPLYRQTIKAEHVAFGY